MKPAEVKEILLNRDIGRATVLVADDQLSLAIGKKGQNVRLAARLTGWNIDIMTPTEYDSQRAKAVEHLGGLPAVGADLAMDLMGAGYISLADVAEVEPKVLAKFANVDAARAKDIVTQAAALVAELEAKAGHDARVAASARTLAEEAEARDKASGLTSTDEPPAGQSVEGAGDAAQDVETKPEA